MGVGQVTTSIKHARLSFMGDAFKTRKHLISSSVFVCPSKCTTNWRHTSQYFKRQSVPQPTAASVPPSKQDTQSKPRQCGSLCRTGSHIACKHGSLVFLLYRPVRPLSQAQLPARPLDCRRAESELPSRVLQHDPAASAPPSKQVQENAAAYATSAHTELVSIVSIDRLCSLRIVL